MKRLLPRSLFGRLVLVLLGGLLLAQLLTAWVNLSERGQLVHRAGGVQLAQRVADIARLLDSVEPAQRRQVVAVFNGPPLAVSLDRPPLGATQAAEDEDLPLSMFAGVLRYTLGDRVALVAVRRGAERPGAPPLRRGPPPGFGPGARVGPAQGFEAPPHMPMMRHMMPDHAVPWFGPGGAHYLAQVRLGDGTLVTFDTDLSPQDTSVPVRIGITLLALLGTVLVLSLVAVRWVTGPLTALARAAQELGKDINRPPLPETGPTEVRRAAQAFNTMQERLSRYLSDRARMLAAMSHDLKTPITRMRLRAEMLDDDALRAKFTGDLDEMQSMVAQTLDYMRDASAREATQSIDTTALLESLQADFRERGSGIEIRGRASGPYAGRPLSLRRCMTNLLDNAIRYGGRATIVVEDSAELLTLRILDEGPGLPEDQLERAFEPFFRGESSRSRETGGTGLGLGIARNIARAHGGDLVLRNRDSGGLEAVLTLPRVAAAH